METTVLNAANVQSTELPVGETLADEKQLRQLLEVELMCIGGGSGDVCLG